MDISMDYSYSMIERAIKLHNVNSKMINQLKGYQSFMIKMITLFQNIILKTEKWMGNAKNFLEMEKSKKMVSFWMI